MTIPIQDKQIRLLLTDCKESFEFITNSEEWETLQDRSSADILIAEIEEVLKNERSKTNE